ncbi:hypothetical protein PBY51_016718 [Eleginops maclovinus]|uniref:Uncharacterized protein n=1 Tax=Eleginops maclovinus TaxID=56733 RepID=A0AAN7ZZQ0_ELEMC|nr:hypothetical protein PBY51_016718 [Eleginops maclovinus]
MVRATPCCHAHAVASRYVAICQCSARLGHGAALLPLRRAARLYAPSSLPLHPHSAQEQHTPVGERTSIRIFHSNRGSLLSQDPGVSDRSVPEVRPDNPLFSAPLLFAPVPFCAGPVRSLPPGDQFIPWKLDELLESCEQVQKES